MKLHKESHLDHGLTEAQVAYLVDRFADRTAFFIETIELPLELGAVLCGLYGPRMGDMPIYEAQVTRAPRGTRTYPSRLINFLPPTQLVTVVAGPHEEHACILYTAYAGPAAPREAGELELLRDAASAAFDAAAAAWSAAGKPESGPIYEACGAAEREAAKVMGQWVESDAFWSEHALSR